MSLKGIISISGMPGLYKVLAQTKTGFIVESLTDKKRLPVASTQRISMLDDISVFTTADDLPLREVLLKLKEHAEGHTLADPKADPDKLRTFFRKIVPEYDTERVYPSDIKKIITWYHLVKDIVDIEDPEEKVAEDNAEPEPATITEENSEPDTGKPAKKTAAKKKTKSDTDKPAPAKSRSKKESN